MTPIELFDAIVRAARELFWAALRFFAVVWVLSYLLSVLPFWRDSTDPPWPHRSGMVIRTDAATGCEYLETSDGGITPRMDGGGHQRGCKPEEGE